MARQKLFAFIINQCPVNSVSNLEILVALLVYRMITAFFHDETQLSRLMRKPTIRIGEKKDTDQLRGNREADQRLCFCLTDSTFPLLFKSKIQSL